MVKIWKGERTERIIESETNLMRKEVIRNFMDFFGETYKEMNMSNGGVRFTAKNFEIDYCYGKEICYVSVFEKDMYKSFPANCISEMFDFLSEKGVVKEKVEKTE